MTGVYQQKRDDQHYLHFDVFCGDDSEIRLRRISLVRTRKPHTCMWPTIGCRHEIQSGEKVWVESGIIDGAFGRCYVCLECIDKFLDEVEVGP